MTAAAAATPPRTPEMYEPSMDVFLNRWFTRYEDARAHRDAEGGYLFPWRGQFFVTDAAAIRVLGLDPLDPDWARIGFDWARPRDAAAFARLLEKREIASA